MKKRGVILLGNGKRGFHSLSFSLSFASFIFGIHRSPVIGEMNTFEKGDLLTYRRRRFIELLRVGKEIFWEKDAVRPASIVSWALS